MYTPRFKEKYQQEVIPAIKEQFGFQSVMRVPKLKKICLNQGLGKFGIADKKLIDVGVNEMTLIAGQKAVATKSRKTFLTSNCVVGCLLACALRFAEIECTNF